MTAFPNIPLNQAYFFSQIGEFELVSLRSLLTDVSLERWGSKCVWLLNSLLSHLWTVRSIFFLSSITWPYFHLYTHTHAHTCPGYISRQYAVWKRVKHWGPAPTVPSCLYELVTHGATNVSRSQSQAWQHLCTSEYISVSLRVLELNGEFALRTLSPVGLPVGALSGLTYRKEQHVLLFTCTDGCHM